jgi:predicted dehydrogenase
VSHRKSILIVGVGLIGERHLRCFLSTGRVEVSLCEMNPVLRERIAQQYEVKKAYASFEKAIATRPDAVVICTPAQLHVALALAAAKAGAHQLIEKPLGTKLDGVAALQAEIERRNLTVAVGYVYRAHPALAAMREAIAGGRFGEPVQIVATCGQHFPFYRPAYRETYYRDRATGGGAVQDALTHILNAGEWLVGPVEKLTADAGHQVLEGVEVEDTVHVLTRHGGVMGCFSLNQHQSPNEVTITVICRSGTARFEYHRCRWRWMMQPGGEWTDEVVGPLERDALFTRQAQAFLDAIEGSYPPLCTVEEAIQTLRVNLGILEAAEWHVWQAIKENEVANV